MTERAQRKLAAILIADVKGYSRLMGADEVGTLNKLKAHRRELVDPAIAGHRGRIVKTTGDGMLVEFASVVDAVRCAIDVQRAMPARESGLDERDIVVLTLHRGANVIPNPRHKEVVEAGDRLLARGLGPEEIARRLRDVLDSTVRAGG